MQIVVFVLTDKLDVIYIFIYREREREVSDGGSGDDNGIEIQRMKHSLLFVFLFRLLLFNSDFSEKQRKIVCV